MIQNKIETSLAELERIEENKKILLQYIAEYPARPVEIERICGWPERTFGNYVSGKLPISAKKLTENVKKLQLFAQNNKK